jgi:predicted nuclease with TOPRIM domain
MREEELLAKIEELRRIIEELEEENAALWEMLDEIEKSDKAAWEAFQSSEADIFVDLADKLGLSGKCWMR